MSEQIRFVVDPDESVVWFRASSSLHPIQTQARKLDGYLLAGWNGNGLDVRGGATGELVVPVGGMSSGNILYDAELRRRVGARRNPVITGTLLGLRALDDGSGGFEADAQVSFNGTTHSFDGPVTATALDDDGLALEAVHTFDVRELGIDPPRVLLFKVSPHIEVGMRIVARRERA